MTSPPPTKRRKAHFERIDFIDVDSVDIIASPKELPIDKQFTVGCIAWKLHLAAENNLKLLKPELIKIGDRTSKVSASGKFTLLKFPEKLGRSESSESEFQEEFSYDFIQEKQRFNAQKTFILPVSKSDMAKSVYMKNGRFKIQLVLKVNTIRKSFFPVYDFYRKDPMSDIILDVKGRKFYVNKQFLSTYSSFFERLFNADFVEKGQSKIQVDEDPKIFHEFLLHLYPTGHQTRLDRITGLLEMADRMLCPFVTAICQRRLLEKESNSMDLESKLKIADRFNLIELKGKIMQNLRTFDELRKIKRTEGLKPETLQMIIRKYEQLFPNHKDTSSSAKIRNRKRRHD